MAWDSSRPVPWKRLFTFVAIYAAIIVAITALTSRDRFAAALPGLAVGVILATAVMVAMTKLGWTLPMLRSREEIAQIRAEKSAAKAPPEASSSAADPGATRRERPAPTKRTSTGHSQHPRRTTKTRRR